MMKYVKELMPVQAVRMRATTKGCTYLDSEGDIVLKVNYEKVERDDKVYIVVHYIKVGAEYRGKGLATKFIKLLYRMAQEELVLGDIVSDRFYELAQKYFELEKIATFDERPLNENWSNYDTYYGDYLVVGIK